MIFPTSWRLQVVDGEKYHLALTDKAVFSKGDSKADLTVTVSEPTFLALCSGKLNPTSAFMNGKVKIKGKMPLAMKLDQILSVAKPRSKL